MPCVFAARPVANMIAFASTTAPSLSVTRTSAIATFDADHCRLKAQIDSALAHLVGQRDAQIVVEAAQKDFAAMNHGHFRAQPVKDSRELEANITAANNHHRSRHPIEKERFVRRNCEFGAGNFRHRRPTAGRDQNIPRRDSARRRPQSYAASMIRARLLSIFTPELISRFS